MAVIQAYPRLARAAVAAQLTGDRPPSPAAFAPDETVWRPRRACFVSLKTRAGDLRGCIGTIWPTRDNLGQEIMANAVAAAGRDPRFPPLAPAELPATFFSVDVLSEPEEVSDWSELDPARWGVIVSRGSRRGLLLPDLPGVVTVEQQVSIAARKAGLIEASLIEASLADCRDLSLQRFSVTRHPEERAAEGAEAGP